MSRVQVVEINTETKTITLESGSPVQGWTALVVATGNRVRLGSNTRVALTSHCQRIATPEA